MIEYQTESDRLVGYTNNKLLMNGQLHRTHTGYHDNKTEIKLNRSDVISVQENRITDIFTRYLRSMEHNNASLLQLSYKTQ